MNVKQETKIERDLGPGLESAAGRCVLDMAHATNWYYKMKGRLWEE